MMVSRIILTELSKPKCSGRHDDFQWQHVKFIASNYPAGLMAWWLGPSALGQAVLYKIRRWSVSEQKLVGIKHTGWSFSV